MITAAQLWGIVIPGWIGAISGVVGSAVALASLLIARASDQRAKEATAQAVRAVASAQRTRGAVADAVQALVADPGPAPGAAQPNATASDPVRAQQREALRQVLSRLEEPDAPAS